MLLVGKGIRGWEALLFNGFRGLEQSVYAAIDLLRFVHQLAEPLLEVTLNLLELLLKDLDWGRALGDLQVQFLEGDERCQRLCTSGKYLAYLHLCCQCLDFLTLVLDALLPCRLIFQLSLF